MIVSPVILPPYGSFGAFSRFFRAVSRLMLVEAFRWDVLIACSTQRFGGLLQNCSKKLGHWQGLDAAQRSSQKNSWLKKYFRTLSTNTMPFVLSVHVPRVREAIALSISSIRPNESLPTVTSSGGRDGTKPIENRRVVPNAAARVAPIELLSTTMADDETQPTTRIGPEHTSQSTSVKVLQEAVCNARPLWLANGLPDQFLSRLNLTSNPNSAINSSFKLGNVAQTTIGLSGLSAAHFHLLRTGVDQEVTVDARHAVLEFRSEAWHTIDDSLPAGIWDSIAGLYQTKDESYVRIHTNFPHHRKGILSILNVPDSAETSGTSVQSALRTWNAMEFESEAAANGMCATALRSHAEWSQHPHAQELEGVPPVQIIRIGEAPKREKLGGFTRPLDGIRVLDLSRVLAGPVCGRTLAAHGADVLLVTSPRLPSLPIVDADTSRGKRTTQLDLTLPTDREKLKQLASTADVFLQAYRPGGLEAKGFGSRELASLHPGIVTANLTAWGWQGPWKDRRGFDSLVQTASGFNVSEGEAYAAFAGDQGALQPRPLPMQALDHAAGYLLAFGINAALCKTVTEGGSWEVRVSLAAVGRWIRSLGQLTPQEAFGPAARPFPPRVLPLHPEIAGLSLPWRSNGVRKMTAVRHAAVLSRTPVREGESSQAPMSLDAYAAEWL
ncbi:CoA-transferase family III domain-containing protein [Mycena capillaripes]|nr:CoA-transferase family III domain-containing protein [Mycena capillaripes]